MTKVLQLPKLTTSYGISYYKDNNLWVYAYPFASPFYGHTFLKVRTHVAVDENHT